LAPLHCAGIELFGVAIEHRAEEVERRGARPINEAKPSSAFRDVTVKGFVENTYLPVYRKKWKRIAEIGLFIESS